VLLERINEETVGQPAGAGPLQQGAQGLRGLVPAHHPAQGPGRRGCGAAVGPIGKAFEGIARLTSERGDQPAVITAYFDTLAKLRAV
jgi:type VI secretion system protein ImpL